MPSPSEPAEVGRYLASLPEERREALRRVHDTVRAAVPEPS